MFMHTAPNTASRDRDILHMPPELHIETSNRMRLIGTVAGLQIVVVPTDTRISCLFDNEAVEVII